MTAAITTTISGVSHLTRHGDRAPDPFEIALSAGGIEFRRSEQPGAHLSWDRVSGWEFEERSDGDVVLTLLGDGAATPLLIPGWSVDDLDALLRQLRGAESEPPQPTRGAPREGAGPPAETSDEVTPGGGDPHTGARHRRARTMSWKPVVAVVVLGVVALAVTLVLLQSAGVISWGFLGPTS